ncbi:DUF2147 domain-containing protein [Novosphingobium aquae]|uniref:DUF2147 domain-containing protein n=1 Tax=Novosphingobium aquae TaxID=3133435 RepID=A0ABU8SA34_9SPHN
MKSLVIAGIAAALLGSSASAQDKNPVYGVWSAKAMGGVEIEISPCGEALCGTFTKFFREKPDAPMLDEQNEDAALRSRPLIGVKFIEGMRGGPSEWTGGKIYYPNTGSSYDASLALVSQDQLKLKVCLGTTCREQVWTRKS